MIYLTDTKTETHKLTEETRPRLREFRQSVETCSLASKISLFEREKTMGDRARENLLLIVLFLLVTVCCGVVHTEECKDKEKCTHQTSTNGEILYFYRACPKVIASIAFRVVIYTCWCYYFFVKSFFFKTLNTC